MRILITGGTGFIGMHVLRALQARGHAVISASRTAVAGAEHVAADFCTDRQVNDWLDRLRGIDVVINAVGILRESAAQSFEAVHVQSPSALFAAAVESGTARIIQISALGADTGTSEYFRSKHHADLALAALPAKWTIVQPSLVYGDGGTSAALFTLLASLPVLLLPGGGNQKVQPIHIEDLTLALVALCERDECVRQRVPLVGPEPLTLRTMLMELRRALGLRRPWTLPIPSRIVELAARVMAWHPRSLLDRETFSMLQAGNTASVQSTTLLLSRPPRTVREFVDPATRRAIAAEAQLRWLIPLLRLSIALVWLWTAITSAWLYPIAQSLVLLERSGVTQSWASWMLYGAIALDFVLGIATLVCTRARFLWLAQMALILYYTLVISLRLPEFWLHPYGPIVKNLPMLAALYLLYVLERPKWNT